MFFGIVRYGERIFRRPVERKRKSDLFSRHFYRYLSAYRNGIVQTSVSRIRSAVIYQLSEIVHLIYGAVDLDRVYVRAVTAADVHILFVLLAVAIESERHRTARLVVVYSNDKSVEHVAVYPVEGHGGSVDGIRAFTHRNVCAFAEYLVDIERHIDPVDARGHGQRLLYAGVSAVIDGDVHIYRTFRRSRHIYSQRATSGIHLVVFCNDLKP